MNWKEINDKYPKAFELWFEQSGCQLLMNEFLEDEDAIEDWPLWIDRELYDFFDKQRIIIMIWHVGSGTIHLNNDQWNFKIDRQDGIILKDGRLGPRYSTRKESEIAAFTKGFELLETQSS